MIWEDLDKNLIHLQADAQHANDIFDQLGGCFVKEGQPKRLCGGPETKRGTVSNRIGYQWIRCRNTAYGCRLCTA